MGVAEAPSGVELERLARSGSTAAYLLFDLDGLALATGAARRLRAYGIAVTAVRGRAVAAEVAADFDRLWLGADFATLLFESAAPPQRWRHPLVPCESWRAGGRMVRLGAVFSRLPEPGVLDLADVGRAGRHAAAPAAGLAGAAPDDGDDLGALLDGLRRADCAAALLVDNGGDAAGRADALADAGALGAYFGAARRPIPPAVLAGGVPIYTWFEAQDGSEPIAALPAGNRACAFVPVALPGEPPDAAAARLAALRAAGYAAVVPRFHLPLPASAEWHAAAAAGLCHAPGVPLDGSQPVFALPDWQGAAAVARLAAWRASNRWPAAAAPEPPTRRYSLAAVHSVLAGYLGEARTRSADWHARQLLDELVGELGSGDELAPCAAYPYLAWRGENLRALIDRAIDARLRAIDDAPAPLLEAMRYTALAGGKRIRPILAAVIGLSGGAPLDAVLRAALSVEWLHTASLLQDDLPSMDDDASRRGQASAHVRHGEGLALLASDGLVAMAFGDLAALAEHPAVGARRASALVAAAAQALGAGGLVGGQARDLLAQARGAGVEAVLEIHRRKTAPLFQLAGTVGATLAHLPGGRQRQLETLLADLGLAFQIVDDLLDAERAAGGAPGSDARNRRASFALALRREAALQMADSFARPLIAYAAGLPMFGALAELARFTVTRRE